MRSLGDLRGNAEGLLFTTRKCLEDYGHVIDDDDFAEISAGADALERALAAPDAAELADRIRRLEVAAHRMAERMYAEAVGDDDDGEGGAGGEGGAAPAAPSPLPEPADSLDDKLCATLARRAGDITARPERFRPAADVMASVHAALAALKSS